MKTAAVHIGAHKTASTLIQQVLDAAGEALHEHNAHFEPLGYQLGAHLMRRCTEHGRALGEELDAMAAKLAEAIDSREEDLLILSSEGLSGDPLTGWANAGAIAADLEDLLIGRGMVEEVRIVLCTRRQDTWLESLYQQEVLQGRAVDLDDFLGGLDLGAFDWSRLVRVYENTFGEGSVSVIPYEVIGEQGAAAFVNQVFGALGVSFRVHPDSMMPLANPSLSRTGLEMARHLLPLMSQDTRAYWEARERIQSRYARLPGERVELLTPEQRAEVLSHYEGAA